MHELHRVEQLLYHLGALVLLVVTLLHQPVEELPTLAQLQDNVYRPDVLGVPLRLDELDDPCMLAQELQHFHLVHGVLAGVLPFGEDLHCIVGLLLILAPTCVGLRELALTKPSGKHVHAVAR